MMMRWIWLCLLWIPALSRADSGSFFQTTSSSMSFTPPIGDYSIVFLSNIFGIVDGVLHGGGSQIMGTMMGVFNSAVLALGGIIIMYIILVSTLNTAHEGEMLGHKWSSIWIPVRTTIGMALLIPKASGYCLMQIFVMWVVVQGVGVADKVWNAALEYLNRGGKIVQANIASSVSLSAGDGDIATGATTMLYGQVCMLALQTQLTNKRNDFLNQQNNGTGPCTGTPNDWIAGLCNTSVPDFISSVNPLSVQMNQDSTSTGPFSVKMPHLDESSIYSKLNGICGTITWNGISKDTLKMCQTYDDQEKCRAYTSSLIPGVTDADMNTVMLTRAMAVSQLYLDLSMVAQAIVNNDPQIVHSANNSNETPATPVAQQAFGEPYLSSFTPCPTDTPGADCPRWGSSNGTGSSLLQGTEIQYAIADYNTVMAPTLNLMEESADRKQQGKLREFIQKTEDSGWILAGSYFFDLVALNGSATATKATDINSGLSASQFNLSNLTNLLSLDDKCQGSAQAIALCEYLNQDVSKTNQVIALFQGDEGDPVEQPLISKMVRPGASITGQINPQINTDASTVYGYAGNALFVKLPGEPGQLQEPLLKFDLDLSIKVPNREAKLPKLPCGKKIFGVCSMEIWRPAFKVVDDLYGKASKDLIRATNQVTKYMIEMPAKAFVNTFIQGLFSLQKPGVNPIVALASLGETFINDAMSLWIGLFAISMLAALPFVGALIKGIIGIAMPLFLSWIAVMLGIGFIMTYYIPFLPYMLFTFGAIAWFMSVIEAIVAAPIVALGVAHPEGHDALGKSEQGLMILMNVFLRPSMMIVGYISGITLSYVGIWLLNAGFSHVLGYLQGSGQGAWGGSVFPWVKLLGYFFSCILFMSMYLTIVQKSFELIGSLPDKVLRWIGGQAEGAGQEAARWTEEGKSQIKEGGEPTKAGIGKAQEQAAGLAAQGASKIGAAGSSMLGKGTPTEGGMTGGGES